MASEGQSSLFNLSVIQAFANEYEWQFQEICDTDVNFAEENEVTSNMH
jgi:hypothetical protein